MARLRSTVAFAATLTSLAIAAAPAPAATFGVTTVAGGGDALGDGVPATASHIFATAVLALPDGSFYLAEIGAHRVRRVMPDGTITTVAGAPLDSPRGLGLESDGSLLVADRDANVVRRLAPDGTLTTVAGTGAGGDTGDGGPATSATLKQPYGAAPLPDGGFVIADRGNHKIRRVAPNGRISTVAGTGAGGFGGDNGPATAAQLNAPCAVAVAPDGSFLIPDRDNNRVRRVAPDGTITTVVGTGERGSGGDGGPATAAQVSGPYSVAFVPGGGYVVGERDGNRIRYVAPDGTISTIAGTGAAGFAGDGGPALGAQFNSIIGVAVTADGGFLVADDQNARVRKLTPGFVAPPAAITPAAPASATAPVPAAVAPRLALQLSSLGARAGRRARVRFTTSAPARVRVVVTRLGRRVVSVGVDARRGVNVVVLRRALRRGRYRVRVTARGADGAVLVRAVVLVVRR